MATENKLWLPPLSPKDQEKLNHGQHNQRKAIIKETGFSGKTLWDWLQLLAVLAIPLAVVLVTAQLNHDRDISTDQQQQTTLETYLDRMSDMLFTDKLAESKSGDEVRSLARARTLAALQNLNPTRRGILLRFIYESGLILEPQPGDKVQNPIIDLAQADLQGIDLSYTDLRDANLQYTDLRDANLQHTDLTDASLFLANLRGVDLSGAILDQADLGGAYLDGANLSGTQMTNEQLDAAKSLQGATMPDGSTHP